MDLYKQPTTKLLVLLLAAISNILLNRRTSHHLPPALKGNISSQCLMCPVTASPLISVGGEEKSTTMSFAFSCLYSRNKVPVCGDFKNRRWWNTTDNRIPSVVNIFYTLWILAENNLFFECWTKVLLQGLMSKFLFHFRILPHYKYHLKKKISTQLTDTQHSKIMFEWPLLVP